MLKDALTALTQKGHTVARLTGGLVVTSGNVSVTIGHDESGFSGYVQTDTASGPEYSGDTGLTLDQVLTLCPQPQSAIAS
jgi:hypothetical protein